MRLYQKWKLLLLLQDYTHHKCKLQIAVAIARLDEKCILQIATATLKIVPKMDTTNCCCYCQIILIPKWNLQIAAAIARLDEKCMLLPLLQDDTTNA